MTMRRLMRDLSILRCIVLLAALCLGTAASAQQAMEIIPLRHRSVEQVLPVLQPLLEPGGTLSGMSGQLILRASRRNRDEIKRALDALDRPARSLLIHVTQDRASVQNRQSGEAFGHFADERAGVDIPPGATVAPDGTIILQRKGATVGARIADTRSIRQGSGTQSVRVVEGGQAYIQIGRSIPLPMRQIIVGPGGAVVSESVVYRDIGQGFYAQPRLSGNRVTLDISPQNDAPGRSGYGSVTTQRLATTVSGRLGEWIELGGSAQQSSDHRQGGLTSSTRELRDDRAVWLMVEEVD